jgi:putative membrane protein
LAGFGFLFQFADELPKSWLSWVDLKPSTFTAGQFVLTGLALLALLAVGAVIGAVFLNWRFLLVKRGELMVSERGLLTRRTVSVEIPRIRGYTLSEGLGMRLVRAARLTALITGVSNANSRSQLLPLGPRSEAVSVARRAVRRFDTPLRPHPAAALRRRLVRSVLPGVLVLAVGLVWGVLAVITVGAVLTVLGVPLGIDRYRSLGHASDGGAFAVRSGSFIRQTTVMEQRAVVGWKVQQSFFQRRAGVASVTALVGAGVGAYSALDAAEADALDLAASNGGRWARELLVISRD